jgi:large subunit ribosomal protein L6
MSRIGKQPITIEPGITYKLENGIAHVSGPKGQLQVQIPKGVNIIQQENVLMVKAGAGTKGTSLVGLTRTLVANAMHGVKEEWTKVLEIIGVGFRGQTTGTELTLNLGFAHPVKFTAPKGITFKMVENKIHVTGADKYLVGEISATIRRSKPPEPYKGKGIKYVDEVVRRKVGKAGKAVGGAK